MTRRTVLAGGLALTMAGLAGRGPGVPGAAAAPPGPAAGVGAWHADGLSAGLADSRARWYYTWAPHDPRTGTPAGCEFVPMLWGASDVTDKALRAAESTGKVLLTFNEPDVRGQANLSVEAALNLWPKLQKSRLRLGAPAVSVGADAPGRWLDRFMTGARARRYRVDVIPVHWHVRSPAVWNSDIAAAVADLRGHLEAVHRRYDRPVWLTEFSLATRDDAGRVLARPPAVQARFLDASAAMLATLPFLERWAWFTGPPWPDGPDTRLYDAGGRATVIGERYRNLP